MITDAQIRNQLLRKIKKIPNDKLKELNDYISKLEGQSDNKSNALFFAGAWNDIENSTFNDLTVDLIRNRQRNKRRNNEQSVD